MSTEHEYVKIDFAHFNPKFEYFLNKESKKKWSMKRAQTNDMICSIIDGQGLSGFDAVKLKRQVLRGIELFDPHTIKIVKKEPNE